MYSIARLSNSGNAIVGKSIASTAVNIAYIIAKMTINRYIASTILERVIPTERVMPAKQEKRL